MSDGRDDREREEDPEELADEPLVAVFEAPDEQTATMVRDFLQEQGVEATAVPIQIAWFSTVETMHHGYWGKVEVLGKDAPRARELVRDFLAARPEPSRPDEERT